MKKISTNSYDVIIVGAGAAGIMAAIVSARSGKNVLLLEKLSAIASKLKATGGGRCNLTNTLSNEDFMAKFGKNGRFMTHAIELFDHKQLIEFFGDIGVETHAPDGYRVFPISHSSKSVIDGLKYEMDRLGISIITNCKVESLNIQNDKILGLNTSNTTFLAPKIIIATGGLGYPVLGAEGDGYTMANSCGHKIVDTHPAMMPLRTRELWVANCTADTIPKVEMRIDIKKAKNIKYKGDLIFTKHGIRGPVVLDIAREITPFLDIYGEVPILINLTKGLNEEQIRSHISLNSSKPITETIAEILPLSVATQIMTLAGIDTNISWAKTEGIAKDRLIKLLAWTPLTITGHDGFKLAMITRGGVCLKEIEPRTMESRLISGLYFCGEVIDLDGPCGGYNLQWSFASGYLAGSFTC
jgi:hypothetical protein